MASAVTASAIASIEPPRRAGELERVAPVGRAADRQRAHDRVGRATGSITSVAGRERRGDGRAAGRLAAHEPHRRSLDQPDRDELVEALGQLGEHRARGDRRDDDVRQAASRAASAISKASVLLPSA